MNRTTKRLLSELQDYSSETTTSGLLHLAPVSDEDLLTWHATLAGPPDTPYHSKSSLAPPGDSCSRMGTDSKLHLAITIPPTYPASPPLISFSSRVFHPNVHFKVSPPLPPCTLN